jgi:hypothetical protein
LNPEHYAGLPPGTGRSPRFVLYATDPAKAAPLAQKFPRLMEAAPRSSFDGDMHVVRPDGYVGLTTGANDWDEVEGYLAKLA